MRTVPVTIVIAIVAILAAPSVGARWMAYGGFEPDTKLDDRSFMPFTAPGSATNVLYFDGFATVSNFLNPNVGALGTRNEIPTLEQVHAILGRWVDCNGDGYIGTVESAQLEYDSRQLQDKSVCPDDNTGDANHWNTHANYHGWVTEYTPISYHGVTQDKRQFEDPDVKVWADYGKPTDSAAVGGTCPLGFPKGTWHDTGGILNYANCETGVTGIWNSIFLGRTAAGQPVPGADPTNSLHLIFTDPNDAHSGPLGQVSTFGSDDSHKAAVKVFDCGQPALVNMGNVINGTPAKGNGGSVNNITIWTPGPATGDLSDPTAPGQVNETNEETEFGQGGCNTSNDAGNDFYGALGESQVAAVGVNDKHAASETLGYNSINNNGASGRGAAPWSLVHAGLAGMPAFLGLANPLGAIADATPTGTHSEPTWDGNTELIKFGPNTVATRISLRDGTANPGPDDPYYITYYAHVGSATTARGLVMPGGSAKYGAAQCGSFTSGDHNGWNCDPAIWYTNADGTPMTEFGGSAGWARVGQQYELRDVDCYDGSNDEGVPMGVPAFSTNACEAADS